MERKEEIEALTIQLQAINLRLAQLEAAAGQEQKATEHSAGKAAVSDIKRGDRVHIVNKLKKPSNWSAHVEWHQKDAQRGTVTHFYKGQVHFVTDNGVKTWHAINNLRKIEK